jgi:hypothetical protein
MSAPVPGAIGSLRRSTEGEPSCLDVRALRLFGQIDAGRLMSAIDEVSEAFDVLHSGQAPGVRRLAVAGPDDGRFNECAAILRAERLRSGAPVRFTVIEVGPEETVLAMAAHPTVADLRSIYLVLGAVMQAYFNRFRVGEYRPFAEVAALEPWPNTRAKDSRTLWWTRRLETWGASAVHAPLETTDSACAVHELALSSDQWSRLTGPAGSGGNTGSLSLIALLALWMSTRAPEPLRPLFRTTVDLRESMQLGRVVGPLTDQLVFEVDLGRSGCSSFRQLVVRAHAGLLDAVVHYLPYAEVTSLGQTIGVLGSGRPTLWGLGVNYCPLPPDSSRTRGEETLARRGLSIELFAEAELLRAAPTTMPVDMHVAEADHGMAVIANAAAPSFGGSPVEGLMNDLAGLINVIVDEPNADLRRLTGLAS